MRKLLLLSTLVMLVCAAKVNAQTVVTTGPVTTANSLVITMPANVPTVALANNIEIRVRIFDPPATVPLAFQVLTGKICAAGVAGQPVTCRANLTQQMATSLSVIGSHNVVVRLYDPTTQFEGMDTVPFVLKSPPGVPTAVNLTQ